MHVCKNVEWILNVEVHVIDKILFALIHVLVIEVKIHVKLGLLVRPCASTTSYFLFSFYILCNCEGRNFLK